MGTFKEITALVFSPETEWENIRTKWKVMGGNMTHIINLNCWIIIFVLILY